MGADQHNDQRGFAIATGARPGEIVAVDGTRPGRQA